MWKCVRCSHSTEKAKHVHIVNKKDGVNITLKVKSVEAGKYLLRRLGASKATIDRCSRRMKTLGLPRIHHESDKAKADFAELRENLPDIRCKVEGLPTYMLMEGRETITMQQVS